MRITKISVRNFRILQDSTPDFNRDLCLLLGRNNTGKTSFTETTITAVDQCKNCIDDKKSFILQGGAGSGKLVAQDKPTEDVNELIIKVMK